MRYRLSVLLTVAFLLLGACKSSQTEDSPEIFDPLVDVWPHDISDIPRDPDVTYGRLDNGLRYALQNNSRPEGEAVLRFWVRAGSRNETEKTLGLAHYLEHMAFNGSENVPEGEMVKSLERLGLSFGADTNASTTFTRTQYMLNLPEVDDETIDYGLFLMRETADKLLIEPDAVERERGVVKAEEARSNTPGRKASRAYIDFMYPDSLYRTRPVIGLPKTLDTLSAPELREFYEAHYRPERSFLVMTGDFDIANMEAKIRDVFADWTVETPAPPDPDNGLTQTRDMDAQVHDDDELTTRVTLFNAKPSTYLGDSAANRKTGFIRGYANAIVNQRISKKLLDAGAPVRGASLSYSPGKSGDQLTASASAKNDDWEAAVRLLDKEIRTALEYGFQQAEYDELLAKSRRSLTDSVNYAAKRRSSSLASGIISSFAGGSVRTTPQQGLDRFEAHAGSITIEDLNAAFTEMWAGFEPLIWLQGPKLEDVSKSEVLAAYEAFRSEPVEAPDNRQKLEFAYQDFGSPGKIKSENRVEDFEIDQIVFDNNVRLNLKKTDFEDKWIRINVTVGEGWNAFPKAHPEILALAGSFSMGGYEAHKVNELSEIFAGKNIGVSMRVGSDRLTFSGSTNPDDVEDQLKAWTALLTAPGYRPEWREKFMDGIKASFHTIDSTPGGVASRDLGRLWANGDRRYGILDQAEYEAATLDDVRAILEPIMEQGAIEIGVVGDFDKAAIIESVAKTYGALPKRRKAFRPIPDAFKIEFPGTGRVTLRHTGAENQGAIYLAWPTSGTWDLPKSRAYSMIRRVFQNRMTEIIREDMGLTYSPSSGLQYSRAYKDYGYVSASMTSDPQYFDAFEQAAREIAADLRSGGITQDELDRARKPIMESFQRSEKENGSWLGLVTRSQTRPETLDWRRDRTTAFENMTPSMLDTAAQDLFDPGTLHVVMIKPGAED
jgi:zinc protease